MERLERLSCGTASDHVHHRGLNFCKIVLAQERSHEGNNLVSRLEDLFDAIVGDEVEISLAIARVLVQGSVLLGEHVHAVGKTDDFDCFHGELACLGTTGSSLNSDNVTAAEGRVKRVKLANITILRRDNLNFSLVTLQINKDKFGASGSDLLDTSGKRDSF